MITKPQGDPRQYDNWLMLFAGGFGCFLVYKFFLKAKIWAMAHPVAAAAIGAVLTIALIVAVVSLITAWMEPRKRAATVKQLLTKKDDSVYLGRDKNRSAVYLPLSARRTHAQVIGTTGCGKTEAVILPLTVDDMRQGRGFMLVDGKPEKDTLNKLLSYLHENGRLDDFKLFSLAYPKLSGTFNPLIGDSAEEVTDRVLQAFDIEDAYYRGIQRTVLANTLNLFAHLKIAPTFRKVLEALKRPELLANMANHSMNNDLIEWAAEFGALTLSEREKRTSGLISNMSPFAYGEFAPLFNADRPDIDLRRVLAKNDIVYFQIPALKIPDLGKHTGRFILQCFANGIAHRHGMSKKDRKFFSAYLDDFSEYLYRGFLTILNKSRSADIGVLFAHQAMGDLEALGDDIANGINTNSNLKIMMKCGDPETAEHCSRLIGTKPTEKFTNRSKRTLLGDTQTGDASVRDTEAFRVGPNVFKSEMGVGDAQMLVPHQYGTAHVSLKCNRLPDLTEVDFPKRVHSEPQGIPEMYKVLRIKKNSESSALAQADSIDKEVA